MCGVFQYFVCEGTISRSDKKALDYRYAEKLDEAEDYLGAYNAFGELGDYKDSASRAIESYLYYQDQLYGDDYKVANDLVEAEMYLEAQDIILRLGAYRESASHAEESYILYLDSLYRKAEEAENDKIYQQAYDLYKKLTEDDYKDSTNKAEETYAHIYREEKEIITLRVGCDSGAELVYTSSRTLTKEVSATDTIEYYNDEPKLDSVSVEYYVPNWGGNKMGWTSKGPMYKFVGNYSCIQNGTINGQGTLCQWITSYISGNEIRYTDGEYHVIYQGSFLDGLFHGEGVLYSENYLSARFLEGTFEKGNVVDPTLAITAMVMLMILEALAKKE